MGDSTRDLRTLTGVNLTKLSDDCPPGDALAPYQAGIRQWATEYLVAPHADLGRAGHAALTDQLTGRVDDPGTGRSASGGAWDGAHGFDSSGQLGLHRPT